MSPTLRPLLGLLLLTPALAGCLDDAGDLDPGAADAVEVADLTHLSAPDAVDTVDADGMRTFRFDGTAPAGVALPLLGSRSLEDAWRTAFDVDAAVGYVEVLLTFPEGPSVIGYLGDDEDRIQCGATTGDSPRRCTAPVAPDAPLAPWSVAVASADGAAVDFTLDVILHAPSHVPRGDPLEGVDETITFRVSDTGVDAAEPTVGVLGDGSIFVQEGTSTMRSTDDGATWEDVAPVTTGQITFDPMLYVDPWSNRVYVDQLYVACSILAWSEDGGDAWLTNPAACGAPSNDHQKLSVGPGPIPGVPAVYYAFSGIGYGGVWVSRSLDGGVTWTTSNVAGVDDGRSARNTGPVQADRDGNVFVPYYFCDDGGYIGVGVSHDMGLTWDVKVVDDEPRDCSGTDRTDADPGIAVGTDGTIYMVYHRKSGVKYVHSTDAGETWSEPRMVSPPGLTSFVHVDGVAGDAGRLAIAYRGTADTPIGPTAADGWAAWHMYVTFVEDATTDAPTTRTGIVGGGTDVTQRGSICTSGIGCSGGNRNLLDFIDVQVTPDGRVVVAYADGCAGACPTPADSRERDGVVAILEEGPRLFVDKAPWAK